MTNNEIFYRFTQEVRDFIYTNGWDSLRPIQVEAANVIFETEDNLILTSDTASGKTEAAFFPIISLMNGEYAGSVEVLYVAPLKSLINDQFERIDALLLDSGIPVFHWHGDVAASHKNKLLKNPAGILQITPESLESMLMNRHSDIIRLFGGLKFVIIDEIHTLTGVPCVLVKFSPPEQRAVKAVLRTFQFVIHLDVQHFRHRECLLKFLG